MKSIFYTLLITLLFIQLTASAQWSGKQTSWGPSGLSAISDNSVWVHRSLLYGSWTARTTDGGSTWGSSTISYPGQYQHVSDFVALNQDTCFLVITGVIQTPIGGSYAEGKVFRSTDGANSWQAVFTSAELNSIRFFNGQDGVMVGKQANASFRIFLSVNSGINWSPVTQAAIPAPINPNEQPVDGSLSVKGNSAWFYTTSNRIFHSLDKGQTWTVTTPPASIDQLAFRDGLNGLLIDGVQLYRTVDGGLTWLNQPYTGSINGKILPVPGTSGTYSSGLSFTADNGLNWEQIHAAGYINITNGQFLNEQSGWAIGHLGVNNTELLKYTGQPIIAAFSENIVSGGFKIFPNPTCGKVYLNKLDDKMDFKPGLIRIYNLQGSLLAEQAWSNELDLNGFGKGILLIEVLSGNRINRNLVVVQ